VPVAAATMPVPPLGNLLYSLLAYAFSMLWNTYSKKRKEMNLKVLHISLNLKLNYYATNK
jgi:hypothetical protein